MAVPSGARNPCAGASLHIAGSCGHLGEQAGGTDVCKQGVQAQVSKQSFCCSRQMVNQRFISVYLKQLSNIIPTNMC